MSENNNYKKSELNQVKRAAKKASYDKNVIHGILDAVEICHIAFMHDDKPFVQPINFGRSGEKIYIHGAVKNRMTSALIQSKEACLNVMILDSMNLTRSAFNHSVNYRSAMIFGSVRELTDNDDKLLGLKSIINHFVPNRWDYCRAPNDKELKATKVIEITITTAAAKIASGPPNDKDSDLSLEYWAGEIPVKTAYDSPVADVYMRENAIIPRHILDFCKNKKN